MANPTAELVCPKCNWLGKRVLCHFGLMFNGTANKMVAFRYIFFIGLLWCFIAQVS